MSVTLTTIHIRWQPTSNEEWRGERTCESGRELGEKWKFLRKIYFCSNKYLLGHKCSVISIYFLRQKLNMCLVFFSSSSFSSSTLVCFCLCARHRTHVLTLVSYGRNPTEAEFCLCWDFAAIFFMLTLLKIVFRDSTVNVCMSMSAWYIYLCWGFIHIVDMLNGKKKPHTCLINIVYVFYV